MLHYTVRAGQYLCLRKKAWEILINSNYSVVTQYTSEQCKHYFQKTSNITFHGWFFFPIIDQYLRTHKLYIMVVSVTFAFTPH